MQTTSEEVATLRFARKVKLPKGFDVEKEIREIRDEWKKKFREFDE